MLDAYFATLARQGVRRGQGDGCPSGPTESPNYPVDPEFDTGYEVASRSACFVNEQGYANWRGTLEGSNIYVGVLGRNRDMGALQEWAYLGNDETPGSPTVWCRRHTPTGCG